MQQQADAPSSQRTPPAAYGRGGLDDFARIADMAPVAMWVTGLDRARLYVNNAYAAFLGLPRAAAQLFDWRSRLHPGDAPATIAASLAGEASLQPFTLEARYLNGDGQWRWLQSTSQPFWNADGAHIGFIGVAHDVTDAREAARALQAKEAQLAAFITQSAVGFAQTTVDGRFTLVNDRFCAISGWDRETLLGTTLQAITHPDDLPVNLPLFLEAVQDGTPFTIEKRYLRPDGSAVWVNNSVVRVASAAGEPHAMLAATLDMTERRSNEAALRRSEQRLRLATEGAGMATWEIDLATMAGEWSPNRFDLLGLPRAPDGHGRFDSWRALVHPDDGAMVDAAMAHCFATGAPVDMEYRIRRADGGGERWLHSHGRRIDPTHGGAARFVGVSFDITERRRIEEEVRRSEGRFRTLFEQANDFIFTTDLEQRVTSCNPAVCAALGYAPEQAIGRPIADFLVEGQSGQTEAMLRHKLDHGGTTRHTVQVRTRAGAIREWEISSRLLVEPDGSYGGLHAIARDVTDARDAERRQQLLINELNHRVKNTLAIVGGLAAQTFKAGEDPAYARATFAERLRALSDAHNLLTREAWEPTTLQTVAQEALAPHDPTGTRIRIEGPAVLIEPKTAISLTLVLHELATNALKHGALGAAGGSVTLSWRVAEAGDGPSRLDFQWRERDGPSVTPPSRRGFGTRLIERALAAELGGTVRLDFASAGLECRIDAPLPEIAA